MKKMAKLITLLFMALAFCFVSCEPGVTPGKNPVENPGKDSDENPGKDPAENPDKDPSEKTDGDSGNKTDDNQPGDPDAEDYPTTVTTPDGRLTVTYDPDGKGLLLTVRRLESDIGTSYSGHVVYEHNTTVGIDLIQLNSSFAEPGSECELLFPFAETGKKYDFEIVSMINGNTSYSSVEYVSPVTALKVQDYIDVDEYSDVNFVSGETPYSFKLNKDFVGMFSEKVKSAFIECIFAAGDVMWKDTAWVAGFQIGLKNVYEGWNFKSYESALTGISLLNWSMSLDSVLSLLGKLSAKKTWFPRGTITFEIEGFDYFFCLDRNMQPEYGKEFPCSYYIDPAETVIEDSRFIGEWVSYGNGMYQTVISANETATGYILEDSFEEFAMKPMKYKVTDKNIIIGFNGTEYGMYIFGYNFLDENTLELSLLEYPEEWNIIYRKGYEPKLPELNLSINFIGSSDVGLSYSVGENGVITFTASDGFTSYQWKLGSIVIGTSKEIMFNPDDYSDLDFFTISLVARKGSVTYSKQIDITKNIE